MTCGQPMVVTGLNLHSTTCAVGGKCLPERSKVGEKILHDGSNSGVHDSSSLLYSGCIKRGVV